MRGRYTAPTDDAITVRAVREMLAYNGKDSAVLVCPSCGCKVERASAESHALCCRDLRDDTRNALDGI